jgi:hypothetical protein
MYRGRFKRRNSWEQRMDTSSPVKKTVVYEKDVREGVQVTVIFKKKMI